MNHHSACLMLVASADHLTRSASGRRERNLQSSSADAFSTCERTSAALQSFMQVREFRRRFCLRRPNLGRRSLSSVFVAPQPPRAVASARRAFTVRTQAKFRVLPRTVGGRPARNGARLAPPNWQSAFDGRMQREEAGKRKNNAIAPPFLQKLTKLQIRYCSLISP